MVSSSSMNVWEENVFAAVVLYIAPVFNWVLLFLDWQTYMKIVLKRIGETGVFGNASYARVLKQRYLFWQKVEKIYFSSVCTAHIRYVLLVLANLTMCRFTRHFWLLAFHNFQLLFPNFCPQLNFTCHWNQKTANHLVGVLCTCAWCACLCACLFMCHVCLPSSISTKEETWTFLISVKKNWTNQWLTNAHFLQRNGCFNMNEGWYFITGLRLDI